MKEWDIEELSDSIEEIYLAEMDEKYNETFEAGIKVGKHVVTIDMDTYKVEEHYDTRDMALERFEQIQSIWRGKYKRLSIEEID